MKDERLLRFEASAGRVLDRIASARRPGGVRCGPSRPCSFRDVYFDTPAGELERSGVTVCLRVRPGGGSTLVVESRDPEGGGMRRAAADLPTDDPEAAFAGDSDPARLLRARVDPALLEPRLELETARRVRRVALDGPEGASATLACDSVVARSGADAGVLHEVELRFPSGAGTEADEAARRLAAEFGLRPTREERAERARMVLAGGGPEDQGDELGRLLALFEDTVRTQIARVRARKRWKRGEQPGGAEGTDAFSSDLPPGSLLNMELSNLAFNRRVLVLAEDPRTPLLERVRFVSIFGANLDEFFRVRVAGFKGQLASGSTKPTMDGVPPGEQLDAMRSRARQLGGRADTLLCDVLLPALAKEGIHILSLADLDPEDRDFLGGFYRESVGPLLVPLPADPDHPFPHIRNLRPALAVLARGPAEGEERLSLLELPGEVPRLVALPDGERFVPLEEVIRAHLDEVYPGTEVLSASLFRVTRSAELHIPRDGEADDLLRRVEEELAKRPFRPAVRLEVEKAMPLEVRALLLRELRSEARGGPELDQDDVFPVNGMVDLRSLREIVGLPRPGLHYPPFEAAEPLDAVRSVFEVLREREVLVHFPYDSFEGTVERFLLEAAEDPEVVAIRLALYRTNRSSRIVEALRRASETGKEVVALVELTARFDEQRNVEWARYLQASGIRVVYGVPGWKIHAKVALVERREGEEVRRYAYLGTGNLNAATAGAYTDLGLLTRDPELGEEVARIFDALTGKAGGPRPRRLLVAPFNMRSRFLELLERETEHARAGRGGHVRIKINGLADREMIAALYRASRAGVRVELIVRGLCALRPGVAGLSENVRVFSLLGRFLEHARIYRFENAGSPEHFIGSADWRTRNLSRRVEVVAPVREPEHRARLDRILEEQLADPDAWELGSDGSYYRRPEAAPHARADESR